MTKTSPPTIDQFSKYQLAWDWFNGELFGGQLNPCLLNFSRHRGSFGFFAPQRWAKENGAIHEISLNPDCLHLPLEKSMGTLVHEMCHQWQQDCGEPPRKGYHDTEWAEKMMEVGLIPSDTGEEGGSPTGQKMSHYIDPKGQFIKALKAMPKEFRLPWLSRGNLGGEKAPKRPAKIKYVCPSCETPIWAKGEVEVTCDDCDENFVPFKVRKDDEGDDDETE